MKVEEGDVCLEKTEPSLDWQGLRIQSLQPGGFGERRAELWPQLLGVKIGESSTAKADGGVHPDERQIRLDTDRSFVLYSGDAQSRNKEEMQEQLHDLLVSIFRKRPRLNYFQGYHDIISVLFLTLPSEMQLAAAEKLSLHRVRDSMGATLEPVLGLLRVTKSLLHLADPDFASTLESTSPLPFYALSNLLTLFSHDIPTLPLIQHVFDYIFCRPPIIIVYLATAIILSRRAEIQRLEEGDEDEGLGMAHSVLSSLPPIVDGEGTGLSLGELVQPEDHETKEEDLKQPSIKKEPAESTTLDTPPEHATQEPPGVLCDPTTTISDPPCIPHRQIKADENDTDEKPSRLPTRSSTPLPPPSPSTPTHSQPPVPLTTLLAQADALHALYPPSHPFLRLSSIMGPQSVVYTWNESPSALPEDDEAEAMVAHPGLVVYPHIEDPSSAESSEGGEEETKVDEKRRKRLGKLRPKLKFRSLLRRRHTGTMVAGAVLVLGIAMAVYGVRIRGTHPGAGMYGLGSVDGLLRQVQVQGRGEWMRVAGWFGGAVVGATEKMVSGFVLVEKGG